MKCREIKNKLSSYQDNELSSHLRLIIDEHLESCRSCRRDFTFLSDLKENFTKVPNIDPSPHLSSKIMYRIKQTPVNTIWGKLLNPAIYSFVFIFSILMGIFVNSTMINPQTSIFREQPELLSIVIEKERTSTVSISEKLLDIISGEKISK